MDQHQQWAESSFACNHAIADRFLRVHALFAYPSDGPTIFSLMPSEVFKSSDGGSSWTALGNIDGVNAIALDPTSASTLYCGTKHGVMTTTDGGRTSAFALAPCVKSASTNFARPISAAPCKAVWPK